MGHASAFEQILAVVLGAISCYWLAVSLHHCDGALIHLALASVASTRKRILVDFRSILSTACH